MTRGSIGAGEVSAARSTDAIGGKLTISAGVLGLLLAACVLSMPWSLERFDRQTSATFEAPSLAAPLGRDHLGRSLLWRCLLGGTVSLGVGVTAAVTAVVIGVSYGAVAGYVGGRVDSLMMRAVDVLYGLPTLLIIVLIDQALGPPIRRLVGATLSGSAAEQTAEAATLLIAIGAVSWLTLSRVIRGQVLSLRERPFIEAARAAGLGRGRILTRHLLPNLVGPVVVYTTLTIPNAMLQESLLSFLGLGMGPTTPSWGSLASDAVTQLPQLAAGLPFRWWIVIWPCLLLSGTLVTLNVLGEGLRERFDPRSAAG